MFGRGLDPPGLQTKKAVNPTLMVSWWCTGFALAVILVRVSGRYVRTEKLFKEDKIMAASIIPLLIRMAFVHLVLIWGTNNTATDALSAIDLSQRELGSRLVLVSRIFYAAFIWTAKLTVLEFLKRVVGSYWRKSFETGLQVLRYFLLATFIAVVISTLAECQPFDHYWQVIPDPGPKCRAGFGQLLTMGTCDMITDLLLVAFPTPIVIMSTMPMKRKVSLVFLFALSLALVAITAYRIPSTIRRGSPQQYRSLLASLEILAAAGVSNSIVIGSFIRDRGAKRPKYRRESLGDTSSLGRSMTRQTTIAQHHWGSDSDLASGVGLSLAPKLQSRTSSAPSSASKPASPLPDSSAENAHIASSPANDTHESSSVSKNATGPDQVSESARERLTPVDPPSSARKMSFFDVGNLMQSHEPTWSPSPSQAAGPKPPHRLPPPPRNHTTSTVLLDAGGLLSTPHPPNSSTSNASPTPSFHPPSPPFLTAESSHHTRNPSINPNTNPITPHPLSPLSLLPPPSYRPRRSSDATQWNTAASDPASSMHLEIGDAGGLLR